MKPKQLFFYSLFLTSVFPALLFGGQTKSVVMLYKKGEYGQVCRKGMRLYYNGSKEPHFAAMVGMACARTDAINPLGVLQRNLVSTPPLRRSATYFSTLVLAKRLLYQHFVDNTPIEQFVLPKYGHILSVVYDHVRRGDFVSMGKGMVRIDDRGRRIFVSVSDDEPPRLLVDEYDGMTLRHRHWFQ